MVNGIWHAMLSIHSSIAEIKQFISAITSSQTGVTLKVFPLSECDLDVLRNICLSCGASFSYRDTEQEKLGLKKPRAKSVDLSFTEALERPAKRRRLSYTAETQQTDANRQETKKADSSSQEDPLLKLHQKIVFENILKSIEEDSKLPTNQPARSKIDMPTAEDAASKNKCSMLPPAQELHMRTRASKAFSFAFPTDNDGRS